MQLSRSLRRSSEERRGAVLVLALIAVVTVAGLAAGFLQLSAARARSQVGATDRKAAFYLAEAGLAESYVGLRVGRTGNVGTEEEPAGYGNGLFWVEAEDVGNEQIALHSVGMVGRARVALDIVLERGEDSGQVFGVYTSGPLSLGPGTRIDSYDSTEGPYADQVGLDVGLQEVSSVGSGADLSLAGSSSDPLVIRGDVAYAAGAALSTRGDVYVGGEEVVGGVAAPLSAVELPALAKSPGFVYSSEFPLVVPPGDYAYDSLTVGANSEAVLVGPLVLLVEDLTLARGARLVADTAAGAVEIYVENQLDFGPGSSMPNSTEDPTRFVLQYAGSATAQMGASGPFHGVLYAPGADVALGGALEIFGSLVADGLTAAGGVTIHFDRALLSEAEQGYWPRFLTWRIVRMEENGSGFADPFRALGVVKGALATPSEAHQDQLLEIEYTDDVGVAQTYSGMESAFDWSDVESVQSMAYDGQRAPDAVGGSRGTSAEDAADTAAAAVIDAASNGTEVRDYLLANSPVSSRTLSRACQSGLMSSGQTRDVLVANSPLEDGLLGMLLDGTLLIGALDLIAVLAAQ